MATTPYSFPHPSAATYPPPPFHGGPFPYPATTEIHGYTSAPDFYPSPFPLPLPPPPAYPYSPPTYEYTATTGFSPTPSTFVPPPPSPPPAYLYAPAASAYTDAYLYQSTPSSAQSWVVSAPSSALDSCVQEQVAPSSAAAAPTASIPPDEAAKNGHRNDNGPSPPPATAEIRDEFAHHDPTVGRVNNGSFGPCPASVLEEQGRWQHLYLAQPDAFNFHSLQPELVSAGDVPEISLVDNVTIPSAASSVAPQVFGKIPTPKSCLRTCSTSLNDRYGHQTAIQSSCLQGDSTKLSEQTLDGWPQAYGFHNLDHHSVLLADGTERRYYALPEFFSLQRATSSVSHAIPTAEGSGNSQLSTPVNEKNSEKQIHHSQVNQSILDMLAQVKTQLETIGEKLRHAIVQNSRGTIFDCIEKNAASKPLLAREDINLNCSSHQAVLEPECAVGDAETEDNSNAFVQLFTGTPEQRRYEVEQQESRQAPKSFSKPKFSQRPTVGVFSLTNEQNPVNELCGTHVKPQQVNNQQWYMLIRMTKEEQKEWDPGTLKTISFAPPVLQWFSLEASQYRTSNEESQGDETILWDKSVCRTTTEHSVLLFQWDPGDTKFHILFRTAAGATRLQCTNIFKFELVHILSVQFGAKREPNFESAIMCSYAFGLGWTEVNIAAIFALVIPCCKGRYVAKHSMFLSDGTSMTIHYSPNLLLHLLCAATTVLVTEQRHALEFSLMVVILPNESEFRDGQLAYISQAKYLCSLYSNSLVHQSKTKNLLSSPHYLQIKKMDIIFRTFRPP